MAAFVKTGMGLRSSGVAVSKLCLSFSNNRIGQCVKSPLYAGRSLSSYGQPNPVRRRRAVFLVVGGLVGTGIIVSIASQKFTRAGKNRMITFYRKLPLCAMSRFMGKLANKELPKSLRRPVLGLYCRVCGVDISEAEDEDLTHYNSLSEFFHRPLKPGLRPIDEDHNLTCPSDGKILHFGVVQEGHLEQVKGVYYCLRDFLGPSSWKDGDDKEQFTDADYAESLKVNPDHDLYHCVVYLAPKNYHRFHSSADWTIKHRRHFPGGLLSVNPAIARRVPNLFNYNERVVYTGEWQHGFFSYVPIGATNVGSIKIYRDKELETNNVKNKGKNFIDKNFCDGNSTGIKVKKGEMFGEFNMGSTVVLVFEAPKDFKFTWENGQTVKVGMAISNS